MPALIFERLGRHDARTDDGTVANLEAQLTVIQRLFRHRAHALLKHAHLLEPVEIIEGNAPVARDNNDLAGLVGIRPTHMNVADDIAGIAQRNKSHIVPRSEEHTSELQSQSNLVCRLLLEKKKTTHLRHPPTHLRSPQLNRSRLRQI